MANFSLALRMAPSPPSPVHYTDGEPVVEEEEVEVPHPGTSPREEEETTTTDTTPQDVVHRPEATTTDTTHEAVPPVVTPTVHKPPTCLPIVYREAYCKGLFADIDSDEWTEEILEA